jgi:DNA polymerase III delta subunit
VTIPAPTCVWAEISAETPWQEWQPKLFETFGWPLNVTIEKWDGSEVHWPKVLDSCNSFTLFKEAKVIVILEAHKPLQNVENFEALLTRFKKGPHKVILQSEEEKPKGFDIPSWKCESSERRTNEKASFNWIDLIHSNQLTTAISLLDEAIQIQHPIALVQLITRDFRLGRLIHYGHQARIRESELSATLKVPAFVIQKWLRRPNLSRSQWSQIFDRLLQADLELKSGADGVWVLRKLTFDLIQLSHSPVRNIKRIKRPLQPEPLLWTTLPSFA